MQILKEPITNNELKQISMAKFGNFVKAVVDVKHGIIVIDAELHADEEAFLIKQGSNQADLWGINLYPELDEEDFIEFDSMINLRPSLGNNTRSVENIQIQQEIRKIVKTFIK